MQDNNQNRPQQPRKKKFDLAFSLFIILMVVGAIILIRQLTQPKALEYTFKELEVALVDTVNPVNSETLTAQPVGGQNYDMFTLTGELADGTEFTAIITVDQFNVIASTHSVKLYELLLEISHCINNGKLHIGDTHLSNNRIITKFNHRMNYALAMNMNLYIVRLNIKKPLCFYNLKAFVHHSGTIYGYFCTHRPVWML